MENNVITDYSIKFVCDIIMLDKLCICVDMMKWRVMKIERRFSAITVALLILINTCSVVVVADKPLQENTNSVCVSTTESDDSEDQDALQKSLMVPLDAILDSGVAGEPALPEEEEETDTAGLARQTHIQAEALLFSAELISEGESAGIYGTFNYIPADTIKISVLYAFGEENYYSVENEDAYGFREWDLTGVPEGAASLTQLCIGVNDSPFKAYLREGVNTLSVKLQITQMSEDGSVESFTQSIQFSHNKTWAAPDIPPDFSARMEPTEQGYLLKGEFTDFLPNTVCVRPLYSLDGENYQVICEEEPYDWLLDKLGTEDEGQLGRLRNQVCAAPSVEPLKSYLAGTIDAFYTKLQITLEDGTSYDTKAFEVVRGIQPLPDSAQVYALFPSSMRMIDRSVRPYFTYGKYQITVKEDANSQDIDAVLPDKIPVEIQIALEGTSSAPITGVVQTDVSWKALPDLSLTAGAVLTLADAAEHLLIPAGTQVHTPLGIYILQNDLHFDQIYTRDEIRLTINVIEKNAKPEVSLRGSLVEDASSNALPLSLAFSLKPSGATAIEAYSFIEGDASWSKLCDLLTIRAVDANQSQQLYGYVDILQSTDAPYRAYLQKEITGFLIALTIEGGVYDGETVILPWPGEYNPPPKIPEIGGSGGNENNAGNGGNDGGNGSGGNGGQRPDLPDDEPPANPLPDADSDGDNSVMPPTDSDKSLFSPDDPNANKNVLELEKLGAGNPAAPSVESDNSGSTTKDSADLQDEILDGAQDMLSEGQPGNLESELDAPSEPVSAAESATRIPPNQTTVPRSATVTLLAVGAAAAIGTGMAVDATGAISAAKVGNTLVAALKKLLFRK